MHRPIFGQSFTVLVAPILLSVLAFKFLNKKRTSVHRNVEDAVTSASGSLTVPMENRCEVFLSFRGSDTRKGFADHLYNGLVDAGIHAFRDDNELRQGEEIGPDLLAGIKNSKILIPILSVNYGSSKWCLDELVQIMECKKADKGHVVLPIFYKVEPAHVRHEIGSFGKAFHKRERRFDPTILKKWKQALVEVSSLKGWEADGYEGKLVKSVVQKVLVKLKKEFELVLPENLVGIDGHVKKVMEFVDNNSSATPFVGIHGMGGIEVDSNARSQLDNVSSPPAAAVSSVSSQSHHLNIGEGKGKEVVRSTDDNTAVISRSQVPPLRAVGPLRIHASRAHSDPRASRNNEASSSKNDSGKSPSVVGSSSTACKGNVTEFNGERLIRGPQTYATLHMPSKLEEQETPHTHAREALAGTYNPISHGLLDSPSRDTPSVPLRSGAVGPQFELPEISVSESGPSEANPTNSETSCTDPFWDPQDPVLDAPFAPSRYGPIQRPERMSEGNHSRGKPAGASIS